MEKRQIESHPSDRKPSLAGQSCFLLAFWHFTLCMRGESEAWTWLNTLVAGPDPVQQGDGTSLALQLVPTTCVLVSSE